MAVHRQSPVYRALTEPMLLFGVERPLAVINLTIALAFSMMEHWLWYIPFAIIIHLVLAYYGKKEPRLREVYMRYARQADRYDPWWHPDMHKRSRQSGFGPEAPL
jgi:type IV secretion system protein VirB3